MGSKKRKLSRISEEPVDEEAERMEKVRRRNWRRQLRCEKVLMDVLEDLRTADSGEKLASTYSRFSPFLVLFSQHASENTACLNALKDFGYQLREFSKVRSNAYYICITI